MHNVEDLKDNNMAPKELIQLDDKEEIEKEYDLKIIEFDEIDENIDKKVIREISKLLKMYIIEKDLKLQQSLINMVSYYHRIATHKFDIGYINGIEYSNQLKKEKDQYIQIYNTSPEQKVIDETIETILKHE